MFGKNPKRTIEKGDGTEIFIQEIFPTLQGEGPYVGWPAIFIRLNGCNLACTFCDTEFENFKKYNLEQILGEIKKYQQEYAIKLIVISGGEPFRQPIEKLCQILLECNYLIQIETNGTIFRELPKEIKIICSPKAVNGKYYNLDPRFNNKIDAFKFLISMHLNPYKCVPPHVINQNIPIYVQPMDEYDSIKNDINTKFCTELAMKNGYIMSLQTHKILNIK
jgi:organic radical activating enzyme